MIEDIPDYFLHAIQEYTPHTSGIYVAQLLWQRGIRELEQLQAFLQPEFYQPASSREFGVELDFALERIQQAIAQSEKITIWGDFDADGITSTAVLWSGLREFLSGDHKSNLDYYIPNRLTESHGLNCPGIAKLAEAGTKLIITCDTGSTNIAEIAYAQGLGIDVIITDHHTLPQERPPVIAILNSRYFPNDHQLANLSGVAVAYKLIEALYEFLPDLPQQPVTELLDLVAIGLVADLVELRGDCRYLAQLGIKKLPQTQRLGLKKLLDYCQKSGDRPTDISFGIAPRLNAISRIHGDAGILVELLTSTDQKRVYKLAEQVELANTRRKALEKDTLMQVKKKVALLDLSTTRVIVLADSQWQVGILGLVAGRIAQEYGKPTILLHTEDEVFWPEQVAAAEILRPNAKAIAMARGSARSFGDIDLYELVASQAHLLHNFGGHPFAAGLSLSVESIPLFTAAINQQLRQKGDSNLIDEGKNLPDLVVTVAELGSELYQELKLLEPCGMGNPYPKLLIKNCYFRPVKTANIYDVKRQKVSYLKTAFEICDASDELGFPGVWWGHSRDELPQGRSDAILLYNADAIVKLDYNNYEKRTQVELITLLQTAETTSDVSSNGVTNSPINSQTNSKQVINLRSLSAPLPSLPNLSPREICQQLLGISKYLSRTGDIVTLEKLQQKLGLGRQSLALGLIAITEWGFRVDYLEDSPQIPIPIKESIKISWEPIISLPRNSKAIAQFLAAITEEQFRYQYFYQASLKKMEAIVP